MNEKDFFENGCFLPEWTSDIDQKPILVAHSYQRKDLQTLLNELNNIKEQIQEIKSREWHLAKLIHFHENELAKD